MIGDLKRLAVGEEYPERLAVEEVGLAWALDDAGAATVLAVIGGPTEDEIDAWNHDAVDVAVGEVARVPWVALRWSSGRLGETWIDASLARFTADEESDRLSVPPSTDGACATIGLVLVSSQDMLVRAVRVTTLSPAVSRMITRLANTMPAFGRSAWAAAASRRLTVGHSSSDLVRTALA